MSYCHVIVAPQLAKVELDQKEIQGRLVNSLGAIQTRLYDALHQKRKKKGQQPRFINSTDFLLRCLVENLIKESQGLFHR